MSSSSSSSATPAASHPSSPALQPSSAFHALVAQLSDRQQWEELLSTAEQRELQVRSMARLSTSVPVRPRSRPSLRLCPSVAVLTWQDLGLFGPDAEAYFSVQLLAAALADDVYASSLLCIDRSAASHCPPNRGAPFLLRCGHSLRLSAKFAWLRAPVELRRASPSLQSLWSIIAPLLQRSPAQFFVAFAALPRSPPLLPLLPPLLSALHAHIRAGALTSVEDTYERIAEADARKLLGLTNDNSAAEWKALVDARGWTAEDGGWVHTRKKERAAPGAEDVGVDELHQLTRYIVQLEQ